jgi:hypothetical protein
MRQTSLQAYWSLEQEKINERQRQVLEALEEIAPANNRQVAFHSGIPINVVTPRMGELLKKHRIEQAYIGHDSATGRRAIFWRPVGKRQGAEESDTY